MHTKSQTNRRNTNRKPNTPKPRTASKPERPETTHARIALRNPVWYGKGPNWIALRYLILNPAAAEILTTAYGDRAENRLESAIARLWAKV